MKTSPKSSPKGTSIRSKIENTLRWHAEEIKLFLRTAAKLLFEQQLVSFTTTILRQVNKAVEEIRIHVYLSVRRRQV